MKKVLRQSLGIALGVVIAFSSVSYDAAAQEETYEITDETPADDASSEDSAAEASTEEDAPTDDASFEDTLTEDESEDSPIADDAASIDDSVEDTEEYFKVSYEALEGDVTNLPVDNTLYHYGDVVFVTADEPSRMGYEFWGWSLTGEPSEIYTCEWNFEITEDVTFYATWTSEEEELLSSSSDSNTPEGIVKAIYDYVDSLDGTFDPNYYYNGVRKSRNCGAFCDYVWEYALGKSRFSSPKIYTTVTSDRKLKGSEICEFLKANDIQPGDWLWCHDPDSASSYRITHNMIIMGYDSESLTITDGYEKNDNGLVWCNNKRLSLSSGSHYDRYFSGNCYITVYKITDESIRSKFAPKSDKPYITSVKENVRYNSFTLTISTADGAKYAAGNMYVKVWASADGEKSVPDSWQGSGVYTAYPASESGSYTFSYNADNIDSLTDYSYDIYLYDENGNLAEKSETAHISLGVLRQSSGKCGDRLTWTIKESAQNIGYFDLTISGNGWMYDYETSQTPWEKYIHSCDESVVCNYNSITLNPGITYIGKNAFYCVSSLNQDKPFSIPDTVKKIGQQAFFGFSYTKDLTIPDSVTTIGDAAFGSSKFSSVTIGRGVSVIPDNCFSNCHNLSYIGMTDNVREIESHAFFSAGTDASFKMDISKNLQEIGDAAFWGCSTLKITDLSFTKNLRALGWGVFTNCESLSGKLDIPGNIEVVSGFENCKSLTGLTLHEGTRVIFDNAFKGCSGLKGALTIPDSVESINSQAFMDCSSLTGLVFPKGENTAAYDSLAVMDRAFENCSSITGDIVFDSAVLRECAGLTRSFYGCDSVNRFVFNGGWDASRFEEGWCNFVGKGVHGKIEYDYESPEDMALSTFPDSAKLYIDTSIYSQKTAPAGLTALGYNVCSLDPGKYPIEGLDAFTITLNEDDPASKWHSSDFIAPHYATNKDIKITIADNSIVSVSKKTIENSQWSNDSVLWYFTPKAIGETTYTVKTADGKFSATGHIRVARTERAVTGISLNPGYITIKSNEKRSLTATVSPSTAKNKSITWKSSNAKIATVDSKGNVIGRARGSCYITATAKDGGFTAVCEVTVKSNNYTVSFNPNGGEGVMDDMYCNPGRKYALPANTFTKAGYIFDHWNTLPSDDEYYHQANVKYDNKDSFTNLAREYESITLYASWRPKKSYTIVYDSNTKYSHGAVIYGSMENDTGYAFNDQQNKVYISDGDYSARGVSFVSWNTQPDGYGITVKAGKEYTPKQLGAQELTQNGVQNVVLYAQWKVNSYKINFDLGGGKLTSLSFGDSQVTSYKEGVSAKGTYTFGQAVKKLPTAERQGYTFGGWYYDAACKKAAKTLPANLKSDTTLYAKWTPLKYTVILDANKTQGNVIQTISGSAGKITAYYGEDLPALKNSFVNKGYKLIGWTTEKGASSAKISTDEVITWKKAVSLFGEINAKDKKTLYAVWKKTPYSISYELNMPEKSTTEINRICSSYLKSYEYGKVAATGITLPTPVRDGYKFEGWFTDSALKKSKKSITTKDYGDITLFAKWTAVYTIRLHDYNSASGTDKAVKSYEGYKFGTSKALPSNPFSRSDSAFMGWALTSTGSAEYSNKQKISAPTLSKTADGFVLDLYAVWQKSFSVWIMTDLSGVSYAKGEKNLLPSTSGFKYSYSSVKKKAITLPKAMVKDGYKFAGWYTDEKCTKKITSISAKNCGNYHIYAVFKPLSYKITYVANPPEGAKAFGKMPAKTVVYGSDTTTDNCDFHVSGYTFGGWSLDPKAERIDVGSNEAYRGEYVKNLKLYAVWFK